jgi:DNA polymerase III subunit epsilon
MYSVIDIETAGMGAKTMKITEIAIIQFDGEKVTDIFETLVNPECFIPQTITNLTGITNEMVRNAPKFYEIARSIVEKTANTIFVAHNVSFDYQVIRKEFSDLGYDFRRKTLCTVELSRKILPGYPSYSLGNLCNNLNIQNEARHRAKGDAMATASLLKLLIAKNMSKENQLFSNT